MNYQLMFFTKMGTRIKDLFTPPIFEGEEIARIARILGIILWSIVAVAIGPLYLIRMGHVKQAGLIFIIFLWANITFQAFTSDGVRGSAAIIYMTIMVLAGGIAHDFNNILGAVMGYTELAQHETEKETVIYKYLQDALHAGNRAKDLVKQILTFSRQTEKEYAPVQVKSIVKEIVRFLRASLPATIEVVQKIQSDGLVMGDPTQIHQVILNLCTNAGYAMQDQGGCLTLSLIKLELNSEFTANFPNLKPGPYLQVTVSDTGTERILFIDDDRRQTCPGNDEHQV